MGKYEKLIGNTFVFAIGSFSSKLLVFFMLRYYTAMLSPAQFGIAERITTTSNLLMPFVMLSINEAIIRFSMDSSVRRSHVFSAGIKTVLIGFGVFILFAPVMLMIDMLSPYTVLIYAYVLFGMLKAVSAQFVRSMGYIKLFAFDGFLATATTIFFNVLFLSAFGWGLYGYVSSIIASNIVSIIFLFLVAKLHRFLDLTAPTKELHRQMIKYSLPLIPTTLFWWIVNASDRYMVTYFLGDTPAGILSIAHKIPSLLTIVSGIFYQAWQLSALGEAGKGKNTLVFYNQIYRYYLTLLLCAASGIIMLIRPITAILYDPSYYSSWKYVPFLVISEVFSSLVTFLGTFYMVSKKNATVPLAIALGAIINIALNLVLIPSYGIMGATFATLMCCLVAFMVRSIDVVRLVKINFRPIYTSVGFLILMAQGALLQWDPPNYFVYQILIFAIMVILNAKVLLELLLSLLAKVIPSKK